jgi:ATP-dependent helicase HrpA
MRLFDTWEDAVLSHIDGVRRLLALHLADKLNYLAKHHGLSKDAMLVWSALGSSTQLVRELAWKSLCEAAGDLSTVLDEAAFETLCSGVRNELGKTELQLADLLNQLLPVYGRVSARLSETFESRWPVVSDDVRSQMDDLVYPGLLADLEPGRLSHYPRYLRGIEERLEQLEQDPNRDRQRLAQIQPWWDRYIAALEQGALYDELLDAFRWLLEEYRVSLFAQRLGTDGKVSEKRLAQAWMDTGLGQ